MVFMADTSRAAQLAQGTKLDLGLHLNLSQPFTGEVRDPRLRENHDRVVRFITSSKYAQCVYNPVLRQQFQYVFRAQLDEFVRSYGRQPSHIDGHHHAHLCTNILLDGIIPAAERVRRSFSFRPGEKDFLNRAYRHIVDWSLARKYKLTDFFFSLQQSLQHNRIARVLELSKTKVVELMTHPVNSSEFAYLMSEPCQAALTKLEMGTYGSL
jgi:hypothetical protein